ncbi:hypothetical protein DPEC_G00226050 [Dallia pectoralis]|uniref:Uncharacterized protein n=1 Tax=Dallia pectoralis TaxID=75939 RepID=A0ACC2G0X1_DALPE|nr:hypothetical protein DPEC_G00226050 [Dallia pectoralis]
MKVFERLMLQHLRPLVRDHIDPLPLFAYQPHLGVEDAIIFMLHRAYLHSEKAGSMVKIMFFDFSSAFNTVRPLLLARKLSVMQVDQDIVAWITDYLTDRPQFVRLQSRLFFLRRLRPFRWAKHFFQARGPLNMESMASEVKVGELCDLQRHDPSNKSSTFPSTVTQRPCICRAALSQERQTEIRAWLLPPCPSSLPGSSALLFMRVPNSTLFFIKYSMSS